jgi:hypothetical protein
VAVLLSPLQIQCRTFVMRSEGRVFRRFRRPACRVPHLSPGLGNKKRIRNKLTPNDEIHCAPTEGAVIGWAQLAREIPGSLRVVEVVDPPECCVGHRAGTPIMRGRIVATRRVKVRATSCSSRTGSRDDRPERKQRERRQLRSS